MIRPWPERYQVRHSDVCGENCVRNPSLVRAHPQFWILRWVGIALHWLSARWFPRSTSVYSVCPSIYSLRCFQCIWYTHTFLHTFIIGEGRNIGGTRLKPEGFGRHSHCDHAQETAVLFIYFSYVPSNITYIRRTYIIYKFQRLVYDVGAQRKSGFIYAQASEWEKEVRRP